MMGGMMDGGMMSGGMGLGMVFGGIFWLLILALVVYGIFGWCARPDHSLNPKPRPVKHR